MDALIHLTAADVVEAAVRLECRATKWDQSYLTCLSHNQQQELLALAWFAASPNAKFGFDWHRDHFAASANVEVTVTPALLREGLRFLNTLSS